MAKAKKAKKQSRIRKKRAKRKTNRKINPQTNQPFEQDSKRRIGPFQGVGEPPIMQ